MLMNFLPEKSFCGVTLTLKKAVNMYNNNNNKHFNVNSYFADNSRSGIKRRCPVSFYHLHEFDQESNTEFFEIEKTLSFLQYEVCCCTAVLVCGNFPRASE